MSHGILDMSIFPTRVDPFAYLSAKLGKTYRIDFIWDVKTTNIEDYDIQYATTSYPIHTV